MTKIKNTKAKTGRKPDNLKEEQITKLRELFFKNEDTARSASEKVGCGYDFASLQFHLIARELQNKNGLTWIEQADDTRVQAIEGFNYKIEEAENRIIEVKKVYDEVSQVHFELKPRMIKKLNDSEVGKKLGHLEPEEFSQLIMFLRDYLKQYVDMGFLRESWNKELRNERIYKTELQMQFDDLKLTVPPSIVLDALMEKAIAEKMNMVPALPVQEEKK